MISFNSILTQGLLLKLVSLIEMLGKFICGFNEKIGNLFYLSPQSLKVRGFITRHHVPYSRAPRTILAIRLERLVRRDPW